jgi:hypothetical protein
VTRIGDGREIGTGAMIRRGIALLTALVIGIGLAGLSAVPAAAADPTASLSIQKAASDGSVKPGP